MSLTMPGPCVWVAADGWSEWLGRELPLPPSPSPQDLAEGLIPSLTGLTLLFCGFVKFKGKSNLFHVSLQIGFTPGLFPSLGLLAWPL